MKFSEMKYVRPDMDNIRSEAEKIALAIENADSAEKARAAYDEFSAAADNFSTMFNLSMIRHTIDTTDKFYDEETGFFDENMPIVTDLAQNITKKLAASRFRPELECIEKFQVRTVGKGQLILAVFDEPFYRLVVVIIIGVGDERVNAVHFHRDFVAYRNLAPYYGVPKPTVILWCGSVGEHC